MRPIGNEALTNHSPPHAQMGGCRRTRVFRCQFQLIVAEAMWLLFQYPVVRLIDWYQFVELHYGWMSPDECKFQAVESRCGVWWHSEEKWRRVLNCDTFHLRCGLPALGMGILMGKALSRQSQWSLFLPLVETPMDLWGAPKPQRGCGFNLPSILESSGKNPVISILAKLRKVDHKVYFLPVLVCWSHY